MNKIAKKFTALVGVVAIVGLVPVAQAAPITAVYSNIAQTATLDPAIAYSSDGFVFVRNVYEGLVEYKPGTMELQAALATSWKSSSDGLTFTFTIRSGVKFHDGTTLDADAVVKGLERVIAVNQGPATNLSSVKSIVASGSDKVIITTSKKDYTFLGTLPKVPIVSPTAVDKNKTTADPQAKSWFAVNAAGTGPYVLDKFERNKAITIKKFDSYWRSFDALTPTTVVIRVDPDIATAMQLLAAGQVDFMGAVGPDDSTLAKSNKNLQVLESPSYYIQMMPMNVTKGALKDVRVRQAIALAFDYKGMVDFYKGWASPTTGPLPTAFSTNIANRPKLQQDLVLAKRLLKSAGYEKGLTITYLGLKGLSYEEFAGVLLEDSLKKIGITVKQVYVGWPQMAAAYSKIETSYDISFLNMSAFSPDASDFLAKSYASINMGNKGGYNWSFYENAKLDEDLANLKLIKSDKLRLIKTEMINADIAKKHLAIYVAQPKLAQPVRAGWTGFYDSLDANYTIRFFYTKKVG